VPRLIELLIHPERRLPDPEPAKVDLRRVILIGMAVWLVALTVECVRWANGAGGASRGVAICAAGVALGLYGLDWVRRHPRASRSAES
jgi:hypothetical protein